MHSLIEHFCQIILLASLAYIFTTIHTIQYLMRNHIEDIDSTALNPDSTHYSASSSTHNLPQPAATTSHTESSEKTSGRWSNNEIVLSSVWKSGPVPVFDPKGLRP